MLRRRGSDERRWPVPCDLTSARRRGARRRGARRISVRRTSVLRRGSWRPPSTEAAQQAGRTALAIRCAGRMAMPQGSDGRGEAMAAVMGRAPLKGWPQQSDGAARGIGTQPPGDLEIAPPRMTEPSVRFIQEQNGRRTGGAIPGKLTSPRSADAADKREVDSPHGSTIFLTVPALD